MTFNVQTKKVGIKMPYCSKLIINLRPGRICFADSMVCYCLQYACANCKFYLMSEGKC